MPSEPEPGLEALVRASQLPVDHGWAIWEDQGVHHRRPFINCAGAGLDAVSAELASRMKKYVGNAAYVIAPAVAVLTWKSPHVQLHFQTDTLTPERWSGGMILASVANGQWIGGGIHVAPTAQVDDRLLDVCLIEDVSIPRAYRLLPKAVKGRHVGESGVTMRKVSTLTVETDEPVPVYVDGEPGSPSATSIRFEVAAGELPMLVPRQVPPRLP